MSEAGWTLFGVVVGALTTGFMNWLLQARQFAHEKEIFLLRSKGKEMVKAILYEMLNHKIYTDRSFFALRERVGGFSDDEVRQYLHELGAKKASRVDGSEEWWYLASRQEERSERHPARKKGDLS